MQVIYATEAAPATVTQSIFLAGPSPRGAADLNWRPEALAILERLGFSGTVFVPLPRNGDWPTQYDDQVSWELRHLNMADVIAFWVPRDKERLPAFTTNVEYGLFINSGKCVLGFPPTAPHMRYLASLAKDRAVPVHDNLEATLRTAVEKAGAPAERAGGERDVPLHIWRLPAFQRWLERQKAAGNRLDGARLMWSAPAQGGRGGIFSFALWVDVFIAAENRHKTNEFIISRPDIACVVAYAKAADPREAEIAIIREFRSPARTADGFIREIPGGSSWSPEEDPLATAAHELIEETGLSVAPERLRPVGDRQLCGTLTTHQAHVFACELTADEMAYLRQQQHDGTKHGVAADTERTYVEVRRLHDLLDPSSSALDWSTLGMILTVIG